MNIENIIESELWDAISSNYNDKKYTNSIIDSMLFLTNTLRDKSNLEDDGIRLINQVFNKKDPIIKTTNLETETDRNIQDGIEFILRGLYHAIRNPRHHEKFNDNETDATEIILFINYILKVIGKSKAKFDIQEIESLIFDKDFVNEKQYTDLIISKIPKRKLFDVAVKIYRNKRNTNKHHIKTIFNSINSALSEKEKHNFLAIVSDDLLKSSNKDELLYILKCFHPEDWKKIDDISKLRIENMILNSIEEGIAFDNKENYNGWFAASNTDFLNYFVSQEKLLIIISKIIDSRNISKIKYLKKYIIFNIWNLIDERKFRENVDDDFFLTRYDFLFDIKNEIKNGNKLFFDLINEKQYKMPNFIREYFSDVTKNFKINPNIKTITDDDIEEDPNDIPF